MKDSNSYLHRAKYFQELSKAVLKTPDGQKWLNMLYEDYVEPSAFADNPETTYANLAVKEFVQSLVSLTKDDEGIQIINEDNI